MKLEDLIEMAATSFSKVHAIFRSNFSRRKLTLRLPSHVSDRAVVGTRGDDVTEEYMILALERFLKMYDAKNKELMDVFDQAKEHHSVEATFKFAIDDTFVNFPSVIHWVGSDKFTITIKTIMVKKEFKTYQEDIVVSL